MFLLKCSCGCFFTLNPPVENRWGTTRKCPNCGKDIIWYNSLEISAMDSFLKEAGMTMQIIPDDAKITVTFDP